LVELRVSHSEQPGKVNIQLLHLSGEIEEKMENGHDNIYNFEFWGLVALCVEAVPMFL
jgi:hypothetical protein